MSEYEKIVEATGIPADDWHQYYDGTMRHWLGFCVGPLMIPFLAGLDKALLLRAIDAYSATLLPEEIQARRQRFDAFCQGVKDSQAFFAWFSEAAGLDKPCTEVDHNASIPRYIAGFCPGAVVEPHQLTSEVPQELRERYASAFQSFLDWDKWYRAHQVMAVFYRNSETSAMDRIVIEERVL